MSHFPGFVKTNITYVDAEGAPEGSAGVILPENVLLQRKAEAMREQIYKAREAAGWQDGDSMPVHITEFRNDGSTPIVPGTTIVMPDHEANQKDEMPFLIYDWRPGYPPLCSIPGAVYRYQEAVTQMEEARYYDQPYTDWFDNACPPSLLIEQANDFVEQLVAKARGRSCFAFRNTQGLAPGTLWKD